MNKLVIILIIGLIGYFGYEYILKEKPVLLINAHKSTTAGYSMDINAPPLAPCNYGSVQGTIKNVSNKVITNIVLDYKINSEPVEAKIDLLNPGEEKNFSTPNVPIRNSDVTFSLEDKSYE